MRKLFETKLYSRNLINGIKSCKRLGTILKWIRKEFQQIDLSTSKLLMRDEALHPRDDVVRHYVS